MTEQTFPAVATGLRYKRSIAIAMLAAFFVWHPQPAFAYVGPGLGLGTLGVILGLVGSILLALFAFFWYPIKRALFGGRAEKDEDEDLAEPAVEKHVAANEGSTDSEIK